MNEVAELHHQAMSLADRADEANRKGEGQAALALFRQAFDLERRAAESFVSRGEEPTRSVLLRSAASLAIGCHEYREAERLIATALVGNPPAEVCEELRDLLEALYTQSPFRQPPK